MITYKCTIFYFNTRRSPYKYGMAPYDYDYEYGMAPYEQAS